MLSGRSSRGALGLRGRIVGAVLVTTVATLVVAALTLLGPLEQSLRTADENTLRHNLGKETIARFAHLVSVLDSSLVESSAQPARDALCAAQNSLGTRLGATVTVLVPALNRFTVTPGESVTVLESLEIGEAGGAGEPFTWYLASVPVVRGPSRFVVPSLS